MFSDKLKKAMEQAQNKYTSLEVQYANIMWIIPSSPSWEGKEIEALVLDLPVLQNKSYLQGQGKAQFQSKNLTIPSESPAVVMVDAEESKGLFYVMYIPPTLKEELRVGYLLKFRIANKRIESLQYFDLNSEADIAEDIQRLGEKFLEELRKAYAMRSETWRVLAEHYGIDDSLDEMPF